MLTADHQSQFLAAASHSVSFCSSCLAKKINSSREELFDALGCSEMEQFLNGAQNYQ